MENWEKEEWGGWKIVNDMLDHPDKLGIYSTSECYQKLYDFVVVQKEKARQEERKKVLEKLPNCFCVEKPPFGGKWEKKGHEKLSKQHFF